MARRKRHLRYEYESHNRHGLMKCQLCNKKIEPGLSYRWWETADAYLSEHRSCTEDDPKWAQLDKLKQERLDWAEAYNQACEEFLAKWGSFPEEDCPYCSS
jgi:hypothetical protein